MTDTRPCTCAPDERPDPCQHQYALGLCREEELRSLRAEVKQLRQDEKDSIEYRAVLATALEHAEAERDALAAQNEILQNDCFNLTEKVIPNLREQRDVLAAENLTLRNAAVNAAERSDALRALLREANLWVREFDGDESDSCLCNRISLALKDKP